MSQAYGISISGQLCSRAEQSTNLSWKKKTCVRGRVKIPAWTWKEVRNPVRKWIFWIDVNTRSRTASSSRNNHKVNTCCMTASCSRNNHEVNTSSRTASCSRNNHEKSSRNDHPNYWWQGGGPSNTVSWRNTINSIDPEHQRPRSMGRHERLWHFERHMMLLLLMNASW